MANSLLSPTIITREALRVLHANLNFIGSINRQYDKQFANEGASPSGKIGPTLYPKDGSWDNGSTTEEPSAEPANAEDAIDKSDVQLKVKVKSKQCFGSAGCNVEYKIKMAADSEGWPTDGTLDITYNASAITPAQVVNLLNIGGFGVGVGEWRPEKDGGFGRFHVATEADAKAA